MEQLMLFTDGSVDTCSGMGCGAYLAFEASRQSAEPLESQVKVVAFDCTSSTRLELQIVLHALGEHDGYRGKIRIHTDSQNVTGLLDRRSRLVGKGFLSSQGRMLKNHDLYREFFRYIDRIDCEFIKVCGHRTSGKKDATDRLFTLVDRAARRALRTMVSNRNRPEDPKNLDR